jgi:hypothetical protein
MYSFSRSADPRCAADEAPRPDLSGLCSLARGEGEGTDTGFVPYARPVTLFCFDVVPSTPTIRPSTL